MIVISFVSLPKFLENLVYYIYMYGFILWSIYRIILAGIALSFFRMGKGNIRAYWVLLEINLGSQYS